jgi:protein involved in polysaccharide export with SLBB domain
MHNGLTGVKVILIGLYMTACAPLQTPQNLEPVAIGEGYQAQYREPPSMRQRNPIQQIVPSETSAEMNTGTCKPFAGGRTRAAAALRGERLSRNDLLDIRIAEDETFSGGYVISRDGQVKLPFLKPIPAQGRTTGQIEADIISALLAEAFYDDPPRVSVRVADFASVSVGVSGAVFEPHIVEIGGVQGADLDGRRQDALGASTEARNLSAALRAVGGVRPDADISAVRLKRGTQVYTLDMRGAFEGQNAVDVMLLTGDDISIPSRDCFQDTLMRPGPISPPGVSLYLSNLTQPVQGNASAAIGQTVREVPYGTRFLQAVIDSNCVGGARATSAARSALLFSRNPVNGVSLVIERDIEGLLRRADRDDFDPYLLPGDALACYDSQVTDVAEIARILGIVGAVSLSGI